MELSEFNPPTRQSLTDEQISQKLGSAAADEAGMLAAMEFLETQTKLRDEDNRATEAWLEKMRSSSDPRSEIALQNFERAKQGLDPLSLEIDEGVAEPTAEPVLEPSGSAEENVEAFEEAILASLEAPEAEDVPVAPIFEEEAQKPVTGFRLVSASNWILGFGVLVPALGAVTAHLLGMTFVTSMLTALVGILVGVKVNVLGLLTARRTHRGLAVASRSTFGVFGSIVPGLILALSGLFALAVIAFALATYLDGRIQGIDKPFSTPLFTVGSAGALTIAGLFAIGIVVVAGFLAIFGGKVSRILKVSLASATLGGFLYVAITTTSRIDFTGLARVFDLNSFLIGAPLFALVVSVFAYGVDGESISIASWGASRKRLTWPIFIFGFILPLLAYSHVAALLSGTSFGPKTSPSSLIDYFLATGQEVGGSVMLNLAIVAVLGLMYTGLMKLIEAIKTLGVNHIGYGSAITLIFTFVVFVVVEALFVTDAVAFNLTLTAIAIIPSAAWIGAVLTETLLRRGKYHDASLTRGYGFYGSVNWVAIAIFVLSSVAAFAFAEPYGFATWFGFLSNSLGFAVSIPVAGLLAMGCSILLTLALGYPRIARQQRETAAVEERRFDLVDAVVD
ncbi:unannotated protein [freshwater metagenome]|uniref:Unannotated protein n=1 Tax=freshwater metagenome TaxID=449393 RepID=A0A6J6GSV0_9ZZZZ